MAAKQLKFSDDARQALVQGVNILTKAVERTKVVSSLSIVDYVVPLPYFEHKFENFVRRYSLLNPNFVVFGNTEQVRIQRIKKQTQKAGVLFRHLAIKSRLSSTSHIAQILHKYFPS